MNSRIYPGGIALRALLGVVALSCFFVSTAALEAEAPVITNPGDIRYGKRQHDVSSRRSRSRLDNMAPLPMARAAFATAAAKGRVYAMGGAVFDNCVTVPTVEAYDPDGDFWITGLRDMPRPLRFRPSGATLDGIIYVVGGSATKVLCNDTALATVQAYDPAIDSWSDKPDLPTPRLQVGLGVDNANHLLYAVGGATAAPITSLFRRWRFMIRREMAVSGPGQPNNI